MKFMFRTGGEGGAGSSGVGARLSSYVRKTGKRVLAMATKHHLPFDLPLFEEMAVVPIQDAGRPLMLPVGDIDEDPDQPRIEFDDEPLKELAATIAERGIRSPVSVRPHPRDPGRWMLNYGARRLRAAKLAELDQVPVFVDKAADTYDQVIENEQREGLKPLELALFVKRELEKGVSQAEIARRLGKSQTYITFVRAMIDPPAWLMEVYRSGKCRGAAQLYELRRLHEAAPGRVERQLDGLDRIGRSDIERLKSGAGKPGEHASAEAPSGPTDEGEASSPKQQAPLPERSTRPLAQVNSKVQGPEVLVLTAEYESRRVRVLLDVLPERPSAVYVMAFGKAEQTVVDGSLLTNLELKRCRM